MTIKIVREKDILISQEKDLIIKTNAILRFKSFINHENRCIELYNYNRTITKNELLTFMSKKDNRNIIKL